MKSTVYSFLVFTIIAEQSCNNNFSDKRVIMLLKSKNNLDLVIGAFEAGESGKDIFVPLLLKNANNPNATSNLRFKGITVYQEKMIALKKILKVSPPIPITRIPDSTVIRYYINYVDKLTYRKIK